MNIVEKEKKTFSFEIHAFVFCFLLAFLYSINNLSTNKTIVKNRYERTCYVQIVVSRLLLNWFKSNSSSHKKHSITQVMPHTKSKKTKRQERLLKSIIITNFVTKGLKRNTWKQKPLISAKLGARKENAKTFTDSILAVKKVFLHIKSGRSISVVLF